MESTLAEQTEVQQALAAAGWDYEEEVQGLQIESNHLDLPRIRIDHKDNGKHRMYVDLGESYLDESTDETKLAGNKITAVVFAEQYIRAYWKEGAQTPACSAINNKPIVHEPINAQCQGCEQGIIGGGCKPKVRLLLLSEIDGEVKPLIFNLSPTSIKHWTQHKKKLQRSNLPVVAVNTTFGLNDVKKNGYRWAEVSIGVDGIASKELLGIAKQAREEMEKIMHNIDDQDFSDPGDRLSS
ncbi:hypothetical protein HQ531_07550 [bacterium]|nr:hypothetical protein [bacterium]